LTKFSNEMYDFLKKVALIYIPALASVYAVVAGIWGLSGTTEVLGTISAVDTALGTILGVSTKSYTANQPPSDGNLVVDKSNPAKDTYSLEITSPLESLSSKKTITLAVKAP
jgi:Putative phage holin Dp-1